MKYHTILAIAFFLLPTGAFAASLYLSPASLSVSPGGTVSAAVYVSTDRAMNAASGIVTFPTDKLEVTSISKSGSIMNLWVAEPSFSNSAGIASFEGVVLNPGFTGTAGKIATITFRAKSAGTAPLTFSSASILANDGLGTNILSGTSGATVTIGAGVPAPVTPVSAPSTDTGSVIALSSPTHPDQTKWYKDDSPQFTWTLPEGALELRTKLDESPNTAPSVRYAPAISSKIVSGLEDGTHYFHLQVRTSEGWSAVSHFKINVDGTPPENFKIIFPHGADGFNPQPIILFNTSDSGSGVDHYDVKVGEGGPLKIAAGAESNPYTLPLLEPGRYTVAVTAYDRAGNATSKEAEFTIEGIDAPVITSYPEEITVGDIVRIRGTSYPNSTIEIVVNEDGKPIVTEETKSNSLGDFGIIVSKRLWAGEYTFTARATDDRGARSPESEPHTVTVKFHFFSDVVTFVINYFLIVLAFMVAVVGIAGAGIWSWFRLRILARTLKKESDEVDTILHRSFTLLRSDLNKHAKKLKKARVSRTLSSEELEFLDQFDRDLSEAEHLISEEIQDLSPKGRRQKKKL